MSLDERKAMVSENSAEQNESGLLIPGTFCRCYYYDPDYKLCKKYDKYLGGEADYFLETYCWASGDCGR